MTMPKAVELPKVVGPEYLAPLVHRAVSTIKVDARRKPESLPPRLVIPGSKKVLWLESDVLAWIKGKSSANGQQKTPERKSIFKGRKAANPA